MTLTLLRDITNIPWPTWNTLAEENHQLFLLQPYVEAWVTHILPEEYPGADLAIYHVEADGQTLGFFPFFRLDNTYFLLGAKEVTDYLDLLWDESKTDQIMPSFQALRKVVGSQATFSWQCLLPVAKLLKLSRELGATAIEQTVNPCITLPTQWEEYWSLVPASQVKNYRRLLSTVGAEDEVTYRCMTTPTEVAHHIDTFIDLHKKSGPEKAAFWTPARTAFFQEVTPALAKLDKVRLYFLDVDGEAAASLLIFDQEHEFQLYNSGFDAYRYGYLGVGNAIILHTIQDAIKLGRASYNFLRGDEPYKFTFGATATPLFDTFITHR